MADNAFTGPNLAQVEVLANVARLGDRSIVLVTGVWDILHSGHIRYIHDASKLGEMLFVGVDSDSLVRRTKGGNRPIMCEGERLEAISALRAVHAAFVFDDLVPVLNVIKPDFLVVSPTTKDLFPQLGSRYDMAHQNGTRIVTVMSRSKTHTSGIIDSILSRFSR